MPARRRANRDPRRSLVRIVWRLEDCQTYVTLDDIAAACKRGPASIPEESMPDLVEAAVVESLLLKDLRTFFDRDERSFAERWVYRVNPRHPIARELLEAGE